MFRPNTADRPVQKFELTFENDGKKKIHNCFFPGRWKKTAKRYEIFQGESKKKINYYKALIK